MCHSDSPAARFGYHVDNVRALLRRLAAAAENDFGRSGRPIDWADVGSVQGYEDALRELCDRVFGEGEHAPSNIAR